MKNQRITKSFALTLPGILGILGILALNGCGGNDPLNVFNDPDKLPNLRAPVTSSLTAGTVTAYSTAIQGIRFAGAGQGTSVVAPADGLVTAVNLASTGLYSVTIFFNSRFTIEISELLSTSKRVGDYVTQGAEIGANSSSKATVKVLYNGGILCPFPFFNDSDRTNILSSLTPNTPCQN